MTEAEREEMIEELIEKMAKVMWENDGPEKRLHGPNGIEAAQEITRLREEIARLREALKPFADRLNEIDKIKASKYACATSVEIQHLRAAAAAIREGGKDE